MAQRIALYIRCSTNTQDPDTQRATLREAARGRAFRWYKDKGAGGDSLERPGLQRLLADARAGRVSRVLVTRGDRLSRDPFHAEMIRRQLAESGVDVVRVLEPASNGADEVTRLVQHILDGVAAFELGRTRSRVREARERFRREGRPWGRPPSVSGNDLERVAGLSVRAAAQALGCSPSAVARARRRQS